MAWKVLTLLLLPFVIELSTQDDDLPIQCLTSEDSPDRLSECKFPFKFSGILEDRCLPDHSGRFWCPTSLNNDQEYVTGPNNWGFCSTLCPRWEGSTLSTE